jgi:hypothetical protein
METTINNGQRLTRFEKNFKYMQKFSLIFGHQKSSKSLLSRLLHCNRLKVNKYVRQHLRQQ